MCQLTLHTIRILQTSIERKKFLFIKFRQNIHNFVFYTFLWDKLQTPRRCAEICCSCVQLYFLLDYLGNRFQRGVERSLPQCRNSTVLNSLFSLCSSSPPSDISQARTISVFLHFFLQLFEKPAISISLYQAHQPLDVLKHFFFCSHVFFYGRLLSDKFLTLHLSSFSSFYSSSSLFFLFFGSFSSCTYLLLRGARLFLLSLFSLVCTTSLISPGSKSTAFFLIHFCWPLLFLSVSVIFSAPYHPSGDPSTLRLR